MPRIARLESESGFYHLNARGVGKRRIFEDNFDRTVFVKALERFSQTCQVQIKAWCLMENHFHILAKGDRQNIQSLMHRLGTAYAQRFNGRHGHVGHVFQGRYHSTAVLSNEQLLATIRYIHLNPVVDGIATLESFRWSSYFQYLGTKGFCDLDDMRELFGSRDAFKRFHYAEVEERCAVPCNAHRYRISDAEAARLAEARFGSRFADEIPNLPKERRNQALRTLFEMGVSDRQIVRLTGIGRSIVQRSRRR